MSKLEKQIGEAIGKELLNKHQKRMDYIKDNKKKYANMVHKSKDHFKQASDFAFRHVK